MKLDKTQKKAIYDFFLAVDENLSGFRNPSLKEALEKAENEAEVLTEKKPQINKSTNLKPKAGFDAVNENTAEYTPKTLDNEQPSSFTPTLPTTNDNNTVLSEKELWALSQVEYDVSNCKACDLSRTRNKTVFGEGCFTFAKEQEPKSRPTVLVIGEGPGFDEDRTGRPFVGRAGQLLDKMLIAIGLSRHTNCYICNVVKCRPPNNREPAPKEVAACLPYLTKQIEIIRPAFILLMGRTACHALLDTSVGINRLHGKFFNLMGIPAICTYHPSALLHNEILKRPAWEDLKILRERLNAENKS
ncbi:MAG: uracil-DNA glycosylase [Treponemataceae bacterium]